MFLAVQLVCRGYPLVPLVNNLLFMVFDYQGSLNYISVILLWQLLSFYFCEIGWCTLLNMGCYLSCQHQ